MIMDKFEVLQLWLILGSVLHFFFLLFQTTITCDDKYETTRKKN